MTVTTRPIDTRVTKEKMVGTNSRWRRFGKPVPAGHSFHEDGSIDYGLFGPGSMVWEVLLHPASIVFEILGQGASQAGTYRPIIAGVRDRDPMAVKARKGTVTLLDVYDRTARNCGMHAPMWLGDTKTAQSMWKHLHQYHKKIKGDLIDISNPELGGYAASEPRDAMWAAITELHPLLRLYEAFAFDGFRLPRRLPDAQREQYIREMGAYVRLVGAPEEEVPNTMAELAALYEKYAPLFEHSDTKNTSPETGKNYIKEIQGGILKNFHVSQLRMVPVLLITAYGPTFPAAGAMSRKCRKAMGYGPFKSWRAGVAAKLFLPMAWLLQQRPVERYVMKRMWGPDATELITSARKLHREALAARAAQSLQHAS